MSTTVSDEAWTALAKTLDVEVPALKAVAAVEASGQGFLPNDPRPKVLFEGHVFHRLTGGRFAAQAPNLSHPKWDRKQYSGSLKGEWKRLEAACQLDRAAALQSASWGLFQIMGFNYVYCGCADVEAFVAQQYAGAEGQLALFARFIARPPFLAALRAKNWDKFAAAYNGPAYAQNRYAEKMAAAYAQFADGAAPARAARGKARKTAPDRTLPPGRPRFEPLPAVTRRTQHKRNVRPDAVDLRDWEYRPSIALSPRDALMPLDPRRMKQQADTNACTGFALATVIEYLLERSARPAEEISGYMLYSMARRYDEWSEDETEDSGSSLRGALKGWSRHGACASRLWKKLAMPPATNTPGEDWWLDAVRRPMGAYYRIAPENVRDIHVALNEVGVVYASAFTHAGWDALLGTRAEPSATAVDQFPVIEDRRGAADQGHAFAIVGYTRDGFIVHNSWGPEWGRGGFAVLRYGDWLRNAMDCWVVQLGVVTAENEKVASAPSLRIDAKSGRALLSSNETLADHEISPFIVNVENEGRLSRRGRFRTSEDDLAALLTNHVVEARKAWKLKPNAPLDVAIYAHGGLTDEDAAAETARAWVPHLYSHQIFPIFLMWETGAGGTLANMFSDVIRGEAELTAAGGRWARLKDRFDDWKDQRLEGIARLPGGKMWGEMKQNANALSGHNEAGMVKLFKLFKDATVKRALPAVRLHLIGHSAGSIAHAYLGKRALDQGLDLASLALLAPAVRIDLFQRLLGDQLSARQIPMLIANLTDAAERNDDTCRPYGHSLLYLVSRSFEDHEETPLLGMEKHLVPALATSEWSQRVRQLHCPGGRWDGSSAATRATTHGGLDDDEAVRQAVVDFIRAV
ncbi:MAG: N-acetylmuramidase domain-containing protein [Gammaproteobacteria bacterium]|nr:N-acetylmuramidase domain-containing protein [Gammaproteobacteria bacterium]